MRISFAILPLVPLVLSCKLTHAPSTLAADELPAKPCERATEDILAGREPAAAGLVDLRDQFGPVKMQRVADCYVYGATAGIEAAINRSQPGDKVSLAEEFLAARMYLDEAFFDDFKYRFVSQAFSPTDHLARSIEDAGLAEMSRTVSNGYPTQIAWYVLQNTDKMLLSAEFSERQAELFWSTARARMEARLGTWQQAFRLAVDDAVQAKRLSEETARTTLAPMLRGALTEDYRRSMSGELDRLYTLDVDRGRKAEAALGRQAAGLGKLEGAEIVFLPTPGSQEAYEASGRLEALARERAQAAQAERAGGDGDGRGDADGGDGDGRGDADGGDGDGRGDGGDGDGRGDGGDGDGRGDGGDGDGRGDGDDSSDADRARGARRAADAPRDLDREQRDARTACDAASRDLQRAILEHLCKGYPVVATLALQGVLLPEAAGGRGLRAWARADIETASHVMAIDGVVMHDGKPHFRFRNSWGEGREMYMPLTESCRINGAFVVATREEAATLRPEGAFRDGIP